MTTQKITFSYNETTEKQNYCHCKNHLIIIISTFFCPLLERGREKTNLLYTKRSSILNFKILSWFNTGIKKLQIFGRIERKVGCGLDPQTCICYPTVNYLRSSALISSPTAWSLLFMKGNRLENEKFFFFFSFAFICCTFPFVCEQKMEDACTGNLFFSLNESI